MSCFCEFFEIISSCEENNINILSLLPCILIKLKKLIKNAFTKIKQYSNRKSFTK